MYRGKTPARSIPPATAFPQTFWKRIQKVNARARKKTPARDAEDPFPSVFLSVLFDCYETALRRTVHHYHQQVWGVPPDLSVDELASSSGHQASERDKDANKPLRGENADDEAPFSVRVTRKVTLVGHSGGFLSNGLIQGSHHDPADPPSRGRGHVLALVEHRTDALGHGQRPNQHGNHSQTTAGAGNEERLLEALGPNEEKGHRYGPENREADHFSRSCGH
jgi:hypothetical protein